MNAKPKPEKLGIVVFFVIFAIMLIASLMFVFEGGWGAIYIFILTSAVSIVILVCITNGHAGGWLQLYYLQLFRC